MSGQELVRVHCVGVAVEFFVLLQVDSLKFHVPLRQLHYCHVRSEYRVWVLL